MQNWLRTGRANFLMQSTALATQLHVVKRIAMLKSYRWPLKIRFPIRDTTFITKTEKKRLAENRVSSHK